jgi:NADH-quinone oxidoreductase subunit A
MPATYIPLMFLALLVLAFPLVALLVFRLTRPDPTEGSAKSLPEKECVRHENDARGLQSPRLYVLAALFVIFSVATIFLSCWALLYRSWLVAHAGIFALFSMAVFSGILFVGFMWLYKKGLLDWT